MEESSRYLSRCRKRSSGSGGGGYLPEELIIEILSWACVTSLVRCKSVCKLWLSIISEPEFIKAQHMNSVIKVPSIIVISARIGVDNVESYGLCDATVVYPQEDETQQVPVPLLSPFDSLIFISSINGIACVCNAIHSDIYLFNPLTRMSRKLPPEIIPENIRPFANNAVRFDVAFGFDSESNDYKVLKIAYRELAHYSNRTLDVLSLNLYSSNSDSWREIQVGIALPSLVYCPIVPVLISGPVVDGVLYLEAVNTIVTFNLHSEIFGLIPYPSFNHKRKSNVFDFEGSVVVVLESVRDGSLDEKEASLWTMEAVSDEVFWNKIFTFDAGFNDTDWVFLYSGANNFVGKTKLGQVLYDYRKKKTKYIRLPSQSFFVKALKHTETLLSAEQFIGVNNS
ncbi:hypothetical protein OROMI_021047 [Orobanche minor]